MPPKASLPNSVDTEQGPPDRLYLSIIPKYVPKDRGTFLVSATVQEGSKRGQVLGTGEAIECAVHYVTTGDGVGYRAVPAGAKGTGLRILSDKEQLLDLLPIDFNLKSGGRRFAWLFLVGFNSNLAERDGFVDPAGSVTQLSRYSQKRAPGITGFPFRLSYVMTIEGQEGYCGTVAFTGEREPWVRVGCTLCP